MASQQAEIVHERCENSLHGPEHGAQAQVEQHEEEQRGPEGAGREKSHHLGEGDECKARPLHALREKSEFRMVSSLVNSRVGRILIPATAQLLQIRVERDIHVF